MELTQPSGLWLLAALGPLVLLYVLRTRRAEVVVSSTFLFEEVRREERARRPLRRLLPEVPLALEILSLVALALCLAGLTLGRSPAAAERVVIVVDTSASMGARATAGGGARLDEARDVALGLVRGLRSGSEVLIVEAGKNAVVRGGFETDVRRIEQVLGALSPRDEGGDLGPALAVGRERLAGAGRGRLVILTDGGGDVPRVASPPPEVFRVGVPTDNVGLVRVEVARRSGPAGGADRVDVLAVVRNFGAARASRFVTLERRQSPRELSSRKVDLSPDETAAVSLGFKPEPAETGAGIVVRLSGSDALAGDDVRFAVIPPAGRLPVVLSPPGRHGWFARAFAADPGVEVLEADLSMLSSPTVPRDGLWVVEGACPGEPASALLVVDPAPGDCLGVRIGAEVEAPRVTSWTAGDPRLRFVSFDDIRVRRARALEAPHALSLVRAGTTTLMAALDRPGSTGTVLGFDPSESDWPLRASFVLFARNLAEQARTARLRAVGAPHPAGDALRIFVREDVSGVSVRGPDGPLESHRLAGALVIPAPHRAGFYDAVARDGRLLSTTPVVLGSPEESDLRRAGVDSRIEGPEGTPAAPGLPRSLSTVLALLCLAAIAAEIVYLRRGRARALPSRATRAMLGLFLGLSAAGAAYGLAELAGLAERGGSSIRVTHPGALLAGCLVVLGLTLLLFRRPAGSPRRRVLSEGGLLAGALAAALAAAGPELGRPLPEMAVLLVTDRSRSTDLVPRASQRIEEQIALSRAEMRPGDRMGVVAFADGATLEESLLPATRTRSPQRALLGRDATDLAAGLSRALSEVPTDASARLVVVSDGVVTRGELGTVTLAARLAGIPVDVLPLLQEAPTSVRVEALRAPSRAALGEALDLRVTTRATQATDVRIVVLRDGVAVREGRHRIQAGEDVLYLREEAGAPGLARYEVRVVPVDPAADALHGDNEASAFVRIEGTSRALIVEGDPGQATALARGLEAAAYAVDVTTATRFPIGAELARYDLVALSDVPAADLPPERIDELAAHVEGLGTGLLLLGGDRSLGPGGYAGTRLEAVSPVAFDVRNERRRARLAEVILIDYSGSMAAPAGAHTKLSLANEAAARSAALLGPIDRLGVAHVDTEVRWTVPLAEHPDPLEPGRKLRRVQPGGGGIYVDLALRAAFDALLRESVELKHVLLFADGSDAEERQEAFRLVADAQKRGMTTSVVALGRGPDVPDLERLSRVGKGRFYLIEDATRLPAVFAQETTLATRSALSEVPFRAVPSAPSPALRGIDVSALPTLHGHVVTRRKDRSEVHLLAPEGDPLLASWTAGVGRVAVFTSDLKSRWGREWAGSAEALRFVAQLGRDLGRRSDDPLVSVEAEISGGDLLVRAALLTADGEADVTRRLTAHVAGPSGVPERLPLQAVAPGAYSGKVTVTAAGAYLVTVTDDETGGRAGTAGATFGPGNELAPTGSDLPLLRNLAAATGGKVRKDLAALFHDRPEPRRAFRSIQGWLVVVSALGLLGGVSARRLLFTGADPRTRAPPTSAPPPDPPRSPPEEARPGGTTAETVLLRRRRRR